MNKKILIADDHADFRMTMVTWLKDQYDVTAVSDGEQALSLLRRGGFDLVVTDLEMPGFTVAELIRRAPTMPAIVVSGNDAGKEIARLGAGFLLKPFSKADLLDRIRSTLTHPSPQLGHAHATVERFRTEINEARTRLGLGPLVPSQEAQLADMLKGIDGRSDLGDLAAALDRMKALFLAD